MWWLFGAATIVLATTALWWWQRIVSDPHVSNRFDLGPWVPCPSCRNGFPIEKEFTYRYFRGEANSCPACQAPLDWWQAMLGLVANNFSSFFLFNAIGAQQTSIMKTLQPSQTLEIDFESEGLPEDGRILHINYTPNGPSLFPAEQHGNTPLRHGVPRKVRLYPVPRPNHEPADTPLAVLFTWVPQAAEDPSWESLVDAFDAYSGGRFKTFIVPANVAVESRLAKLMSSLLLQTNSKGHVEPFLRTNATYGSQLNVLLPALLQPRNVPLLRNEIRGRLNRLRDLRNELAHSGTLAQPLVQPEAGELLCAAFFGFRYVQFVEGELAV